MPVEFKLPDVGEGLTEAEVVTWLVEPGDPVTEDQPVAEVETDKAVVEVPSPVNGTVRELYAEEGEMVPVGAVLLTFDVEGDVDEEELEIEPEIADGEAEVEAETGGGGAEPEAGTGDGESTSPSPSPSTSEGGRVFAAPSARRLARELGVDIGRVEGSGPGGRVTEGDVRAAAEAEAEAEAEGEAETEADVATETATEAETIAETGAESADPTRPAESGEPPEAAKPTGAADRDRTLAAPATRKLAADLDVDIHAVPAVEQRDGEAFVTPEAVREYAEAQRAAREAEVAGEAPAEAGGAAAGVAERPEREERVAYKGIRRTIAEAMERSKYTAPHVTHHDVADATALVEVRNDLKEEAAGRGIKLTYMPFVAKAIVAALKQHPVLNSTLDEENEQIVKKYYYNIGVAVATDAGLMVPVVKNADGKSLLQIASEMNELVEKARERSIAREEMQGGTFTVTNFGAIGGEYATPIINYPETAVLGLGAIEERPHVVDGEVTARATLPLSLSIDHRVIDGADGARFANTLIRYLENPHLLLLE